MPMADLGDRDHVHVVIETAVAAPGQSVDFAVTEDISTGAVPL
jgi:hypothetical protein